MATETTVIDIKIADAQAAGSIKDLRKSLKGLIDELQNVPAGSKEFAKLSKTINDTEGKIGDLTDSFQTLKGSGIERTNASMGLLREGFQNFDTDKIKAGLNGVGAAFKAIPIFLVVQGIQYLVENFKELSQGSGILAKSLQFVGDILTAIGDGITWLTDNIGLTNSALEEMGDKAVEMADKSTEALAAQSAEYDRLAKEAKIAGKSAVEFEIAKQQAIIDTNVAILKQLLAYKEAGGELSEEQMKLLTSSTAALKAATTERKLIQFNEAEETKKKDKEAYDNWYKLEQQKIDDKYKAYLAAKAASEEEAAFQQRGQDEIDKINLEKRADYLTAYNEQEATYQANRLNETANEELKANEKSKKLAKDKEAYRETLERQTLNASRALSDVYFQFQLNQAKGNEKRQLEIKKQAFQVDKAFQVAQASIDGYRAAISAYAGAPPGFKIASAALAATFAAAQVAKILATKFDSGSPSSGGANNDISGSQGSANIPTPATSTAPTTQASTTFDSQGRNQNFTITAKVYEGDMTSTQKRAAKIDSMTTI